MLKQDYKKGCDKCDYYGYEEIWDFLTPCPSCEFGKEKEIERLNNEIEGLKNQIKSKKKLLKTIINT